MILAIFSDGERRDALSTALASDGIKERIEKLIFYESYDELIAGLPESLCDAVIVAYKGARGMQGARAAKILLARKPLIWFSDDSGFLEESYRLGCVYFSPDAVTADVLRLALERCKNEGSA